jgi:hypothetical protein
VFCSRTRDGTTVLLERKRCVMKNDDQYEESADSERDHDAQWRERIQRALRDLRSSSIVERPNPLRARAE